MGWFEAKAKVVHARAGSPGVTVSLRQPPTANTMTLRIRLGSRAMAATGWKAEQHVKLLFGDDENAGSVMIRSADEKDYPRLRGLRDALEAKFGHVWHQPIPGVGGAQWTLPKEVKDAVELGGGAWRVEENALVVTLPREWWRVEEAIEDVAAAVYAEARHDPHAEAATARQALADPGPPRSDPNDPKVQEMALHLLSHGCSLPALRKRLRLDEAGFGVLREALRQRTIRSGAPKIVPEPPPSADTPAELERIRRMANPNGAAA